MWSHFLPLRRKTCVSSVDSQWGLRTAIPLRGWKSSTLPVTLHGFKTMLKVKTRHVFLIRSVLLYLYIFLYLNFSFPLRSQHPFSLHGLQLWGAENKWIFKMRKHHEVSSDWNLHSRVLLQKSRYPDVSRLYKFKLWSEQNSFIEWFWPIFFGLLSLFYK